MVLTRRIPRRFIDHGSCRLDLRGLITQSVQRTTVAFMHIMIHLPNCVTSTMPCELGDRELWRKVGEGCQRDYSFRYIRLLRISGAVANDLRLHPMK